MSRSEQMVSTARVGVTTLLWRGVCSSACKAQLPGVIRDFLGCRNFRGDLGFGLGRVPFPDREFQALHLLVAIQMVVGGSDRGISEEGPPLPPFPFTRHLLRS